MKIVLRTLVFHFICIFIFAFLYKYLSKHFIYDKNRYTGNEIELVDYFTLSVTIQAGIGYSDLYPISHIGKIILMIHQFIVISTHVFTIYIFTI
jgi:hypothetical protein